MVGLSATVSKPVNRHADINIFTVASGLLYEVSGLTIPMTLADAKIAFRIDHDPQRDETYQQLRQVLVHRASPSLI